MTGERGRRVSMKYKKVCGHAREAGIQMAPGLYGRLQAGVRVTGSGTVTGEYM